MNERILLWGLGVGFELRKNDLFNMVDRYNLNIIGVTAKAPDENNTFFHFYCKDEINPSLADYIVVTTGLDYFDQIKKEALCMGFESYSVLSLIDLKTYDYNWSEYLENRGGRQQRFTATKFFSFCGKLLWWTVLPFAGKKIYVTSNKYFYGRRRLYPVC